MSKGQRLARGVFGIRGRFGRISWWILTACMFQLYSVALGILFNYKTDAAIVLAAALAALALWLLVATNAKRLHDLGRSGWWQLLLLVPIAGPLGMVVWLGFFEGQPAPNQFGAEPQAWWRSTTEQKSEQAGSPSDDGPDREDVV